MLDLETSTLNEIAMLERVRVHGVLGLVPMGSDFLTVYFRWEPTCTAGRLTLRKMPTLIVERPITSILSPHGAFHTALEMQDYIRPNGTMLHS